MLHKIFALLNAFLLSVSGSIFAADDYSMIRPKTVFTDAQAYPSAKGEYDVEKIIDENPETFTCLLDTSRMGNRNATIPAQGSEPVTGRITLDFGVDTKLSGLALTARNNSQCYLPKIVNITKSKSVQYTQKDNEVICSKRRISRISAGQTFYILFDHPETSRYFTLDVLDSYECGPKHYNFQIAEIRGFRGTPPNFVLPNPPQMAFPEQRLLYDWLCQDSGSVKNTACFTSNQNANTERTISLKCLEELQNAGVDIHKERSEFDSLVQQNIPGKDPQWRQFYKKICYLRRIQRLEPLLAETTQIIYTKHCLLSGPVHYAWTDEITDQQYVERIAEFRPGVQLCMLTLKKDGSVSNEVLLEKPDGMIRDPNLSFDAKEVVFSARDSYTNDDFHLYIMDLADRSVRQITKGKAVSDVEPAFLPNGDLVFQSSRCVQLTDCWRQAVSNIYTCRTDGSNLHRLCFDQVHTNYPQILDDGRVLYTRWEYNDRGQIFPQPLFTMNPDGTSQTALYGENSWFPTSILHARGIPGTAKVIGIASGHHVHQRGKLILVDRSSGTQGNDGIEFLAPRRPSKIPPIEKFNYSYDFFGQTGEQFQYPFALDEDHYLVTYSPEGYKGSTNLIIYDPPFGVYWMDSAGHRELLAWDPTVSCNQQIPVATRPVPPIKPSSVDLNKSRALYYLQNVYIGDSMKNIKKGEAKKLRIVGIEFRAADVSYNSNISEAGQSHVRTPIAINNGSWDVKHVLGEVDINSDGSAYFEVPARTPIYFQVLDEKGYAIASMRSWSTLQPGETFACIGCHEDKLQTYPNIQAQTEAMKKPAQKLRPAPGSTVDPYTYGSINSVQSYLGVNCAKGEKGPYAGFSYLQNIQPILDRHCVECHNGTTGNGRNANPDLSGKVGSYSWNQCPNNGDSTQNPLRNFTISYLNLTNFGHGGPLVNWINAQSRPTLLPPRFTGAIRSQLMNYLDESHYKVKLTDAEKRIVACWIDLCVPFCGSYTEANQWNPEQKKTYDYFEKKREHWAAEEINAIRKK